MNQAKELRLRAEGLEEANSYRSMSAADQEFLDSSEFGPTLPDKIARLVLKCVQLDRAKGAPSTELSFFLDLLNENLAKLRNFTQVVSELPLREFTPRPDEITFSIVVSERSFVGDLTTLSKVFEQFDRFVGVVHEVTGSHGAKPRVLFLDNGSAIVVLAATAAVVQSVISMYSAVVEAAHLTSKMLSAMGVLTSNSAEHGISREKLEELGNTYLEKALTKQLDAIVAETQREVPEGLRSKLRISSSILIERIREGSKITVDTVSERETQKVGEGVELDQELAPEAIEKRTSIIDLLAQSRALEKIANAVAGESEPTLQLDRPADGQADV